MRRIVLTALSLAAAVLAGLFLTGHLPSFGVLEKFAERKRAVVAAPIAPAVSVVRAERTMFVDTLLVTGSLVARDEILVGPEIEGLRVVEVLVDEGDSVKSGQVLARLVHDTIDTQLAQNAAALARADAGIAQAHSSIVQAEARVVEARNAFERARTLKAGGNIADSLLDQRESAAKTAEAQLVAARDGLKLAEADKGQAEAQRRDLVWRRGKTEVTAPSDGIVSRRIAKVGGMAVGAGEPMFRLIANGSIELEAEVIETRVAGVQEGQPARIQVAGAGFYDGTVRLVAKEIDRTTRLGRVRLLIGARPELKIGTFARATIETGRSRGIGVPSSAVLYTDDSSIVQVVSNGRISTRKVETGLAAAGLIEIRRGVAEGDLVVAKSGTFLRDGDAIRPINGNGTRLSEADGRGALQ